ncbi:hypothetical protein llap_1927 [Limosa lapponica baueri]|uniref:Uncharacterized protein n=1 Tax=Limosa lapponica baueri TaxID=1758121 RepID=A0A2I0UNW7_LIMLA|nr:hypothetical protein llap_1927 [Limosa lapponica baueri]
MRRLRFTREPAGLPASEKGLAVFSSNYLAHPCIQLGKGVAPVIACAEVSSHLHDVSREMTSVANLCQIPKEILGLLSTLGSLNLTTNVGLGFKNHHPLKAKLSDAGTTYGYNKKKHSQRLLITHESVWKGQGPLGAEDLQAAVLTYQDMWKAASFSEYHGGTADT